jgi:mono/diheme cytochrome c family protein
MPPLGTTFSDDQIAGVLTFVRRSWGNQASAVDPGRGRRHSQADRGADAAVD